MNQSFDLIILGAGPGGYKAAEAAARQGLSVAIVERGDVGGTCLNVGCIPTKALAHIAEQYLTAKELCGEVPQCPLSDYLTTVTTQLRTGVETLLSQPGITLLRGEGAFIDAHTVEVRTEGQETEECQILTAPFIIVATGSESKMIPVCREASHPLFDSTQLLRDIAAISTCRSCCIIGAGVIGMEFAGILAALGLKVNVVELARECLPMLDSDIAKRLRRSMEQHLGITFHMQSTVAKLETGKAVIERRGKQTEVEADFTLMAVGRRPAVADHFRLAGFNYDERCGIAVDDTWQTTVDGIYAIGDVNGRFQLAHAAEMQAEQVVATIAARKRGEAPAMRQDVPPVIPAAIFTHPEAACVGLSEDDCKAQGIDYVCGKAFMRANGRAVAMSETDGMVKLLSRAENGEIIGCHAFGAQAAAIVQEVTALMHFHATTAQLRAICHIHPTVMEVLRDAAGI